LLAVSGNGNEMRGGPMKRARVVVSLVFTTLSFVALAMQVGAHSAQAEQPKNTRDLLRT
jgi:hypothetical protein